MFDILIPTAASLGFFHTAVGIDHSVPFVALARERNWSLARTLRITFACGVLHVLSSMLLGVVGIWFGESLDALGAFDSFREKVASYLLIGFGGAYALYGIFHARRHASTETAENVDHPAFAQRRDRSSTVSVATLVIIFVLGPCEALIPLMMAPAAAQEPLVLVEVVFAFSVATIVAMLVAVTVLYVGATKMRFPFLQRHLQTFAGLAICSSGIAVNLFGI